MDENLPIREVSGPLLMGDKPLPLAQPQKAPRRRPPRRKPNRTRQPTPYQAQRAAMQDLPLQRLRRYGFTPYCGEDKRFLMTPPDCSLVWAFEARQVALVIHAVLAPFVGYPGDNADGRREWVARSFRHCERRGLLGRHAAQEALADAVEQGYLLRRRRGRQRWEYAMHYRQVDHVPR